MNDAKEINIEVIEEWVAGKGIHPVNWKTLTEVLRDIEQSTLAEEIESQTRDLYIVFIFSTAIYLVILLHCRNYCCDHICNYRVGCIQFLLYCAAFVILELYKYNFAQEQRLLKLFQLIV